MINIKKGSNLKLISLAITVLFLFTGTSYSSISKDLLRVPLEDDYSRMEEIMQDGKPQESQTPTKLLTRPFLIPGTNIRFNVTEIRDHEKMQEIVDEWFLSKIERDFNEENNVWEKDIENLKKYPRGSMIILRSERGEILGISIHHKETDYMLFKDSDTRSEHIGDFYFTDHTEISGPFRGKELGFKIVAKRAEIILNDPDMKDEDLMLVARPATVISDKYLEKIGGEKYILPREQFGYSPEEEFDHTRRILGKNTLETILENAKKQQIPQQLSLFESIEDMEKYRSDI